MSKNKMRRTSKQCSNKHIKAYVKESSIKDYGKGLFAKIPIKRGSIVAEFKGKLLKPGTSPTSNRTNIYFVDEYILECPHNDLASFANDAINFPRERRHLMANLKSTEPFYRKHPKTKINTEIKNNDNLHRSFLIAVCDIAQDEEIFCHYGFDYWYNKTLTEVGFLEEDEIEKNGFPDNIYDYPAFVAYLKEFYPDHVRHEVKRFKNGHDVILYFDRNDIYDSVTYIVMPIKTYSHRIDKVDGKSFDKN